MASLNVDIVEVEALTEADRAAWRAMLAADPALDSPYFRPEFAEVAGRICPNAAVAVFSRAGETVGFFPHQRRGGLIQPLGAPLSDYHGVIARAGERLDPATVAQHLGGVLRVGGWVSPAGAVPGFLVRNRMAADVSGGRDALVERMEARNHRFFKNMRRLRRGFEREHGEPVFTWDDREAGVLDWIIARKRDQYRRSRRHDVFACGWTGALLHALSE
ncbi:MAG: GNAT family N-acetyltransferase, partial [Brevundimonas sp.]